MTLPGLDTCISYWVTITATSYCGLSATTEPVTLGIKDSIPFGMEVILPDVACNDWIKENEEVKISDMELVLLDAATSCSLEIPCFRGSQWQCATIDDKKVTFQ